MARRLPVVVSQSSSGSAVRRNLEESLITNLLLEAGLDLNIVPHIADLSADQTGALCLEGISGPMVLISWLSAVEAQAELEKIGIGCRLGRTAFDAGGMVTGGNGNRLLYAISFNGFESPDPICAEIRRIRDDLGTPTMSISGLSSAIHVAEVPVHPTPIHPTIATPPPAAANTGVNAATPIVAQTSSDDDDPELEKLVDMLDKMDL